MDLASPRHRSTLLLHRPSWKEIDISKHTNARLALLPHKIKFYHTLYPKKIKIMADEQERRLVSIMVKPKAGVDAVALYDKIKSEVTSQEEYKIKWDDACKVENGKIYTSFTIALEADFDEEVMEVIECMEDEVEDQQITYQAAMEG
mmetsp:Transcript_39529/g.59801  ORF Transcript_39529/g.59801 Transcript_39529/m.59801 type:complete len:147 (+) Transcript_39529:23-463(+)